jgi:hypothetical protein
MDMTPLPNGIHHDIPEDIYRADLGLNQSTLKAFGRANSPAHFRWYEQRPRKETPELRIGNFVDATLFAPKKLLSFAMWPEHRKGKAWETFEQANSTKTILNGPEYERARNILLAIEAHDDATKLIKACQYQVVVIGDHPALKFRMKGALDMLPDLSRCSALLADYVFDLKCTADASDEGFVKQCATFGYHIQAAYYMDLLILCGRKVKTFGFIAAENDAPFGIKIHWFPIDSLEIRRARELYEKWMFEYMECVKKNVWPSYSSEWSRIRFKPWMLDEVETHADVLE